MSEEQITQIKIGEVCVVREYLADGSGSGYLFGVFNSEAEARLTYGDASGVHVPHFDVVPLWAASIHARPTSEEVG